MVRVHRLFSQLLGVILVATIAASGAFAKPIVSDVRIGVHSGATRVVLDLDGEVAYTIFTLPQPYRVIVDLPEVEWRMSTTPAMRGVIQRFRYGLFQPGMSRLVLDVATPSVVERAFTLKPTADFGYRLVIDLRAVSAEEFGRQARLTPPPKPQPPAPTAGPPPPTGGKPLIVIDAGHGGVDPGTISAAGTREKRLTLLAAIELKRQLEASGHYRVLLTRSNDVFVPLAGRVAIAHNARADLFISLHADSMANKKVRGASVYTLSEKSYDAESAALAARENKSDVLAGIDLVSGAYDADVTDILIDLARRETMEFSAQFSKVLIPELGKSTKLLRKTHRFAGFRVLKAPEVPSVLVELGYLSNREDERALRDPITRAGLMTAIASAIDLFFVERKSASRS